MRRMGEKYGFQFDAVASEFVIQEGCTDAPPLVCGFDLTPKNSSSQLGLSFGPHGFESMDMDPTLTFSERFEKRVVLDDTGQRIGEDYWGYLDTEKRWRRIHLWGGVYAKYDLANERDAGLFDRVINSACLLLSPGP